MPAKIAAFLLVIFFSMLYLVYSIRLLKLIRSIDRDFIEAHGLPRWDWDLSARPAGVLRVIVTRRYAKMRDRRIRRSGDLALAWVAGVVLSILGVLFLPGNLWIWK